MGNSCASLYPFIIQKFVRFLPLGLLFFVLATDLVLAAPSTPSKGKLYHANPGPWGKLTYYYVYLEAPDEYLKDFPIPSTTSQWVFEGKSLDEVDAILESAGLSSALREHLTKEGNYLKVDNSITVFLPIPDLEALTAEQRSYIYRELAKYPINEFHANPVYLPDGSVRDWLKDSSLPERAHDIFEKLCYSRGKVLAFSDVAVLLNYLNGEEEIHAMLRALTRTRSMIVRLDFSQGASVDELVNYWTGRKRFKSILPFLESVVETDGVNSFDIVHLMPSLARRYIYTYPPLEYGSYGRMPDCHWTSFNFFNHIPKQYFLDSRLSAESIETSYDRVDQKGGALEFGDILMFVSDPARGEVIHSCVYIADDIVYTKNGESILAPWILSRMDEVKNLYFPDGVGEIQVYRRKAQK